MDRHPTTVGPDYRDHYGHPARLVLCPRCGLFEWWTEEECSGQGRCRDSVQPLLYRDEEEDRETWRGQQSA